jgi:predicted dehydrogenase
METIIKLAVVGLGNMGRNHCRDINNIENAELTAVCDMDKERSESLAVEYGCASFTSAEEMMDSTKLDGIIIATPHFDHLPLSKAAFKKGIHVLTEKPVGVHVKDVNAMIKAWKEGQNIKEDLIFAAMFQQRTQGIAKKIKALLDSGELGKLIRTTWIITDWYRTQAYFNSGGWRATWKGEGGGVLMNQCPHQLDMYQWFVGCPDRVMGMVSLGKYHEIEVEDEVTAYFEYDNGMVGHFITSTGEAPGSNRLEIVGEFGKLIWEADKLIFHKNQVSLLEHMATAEGGFEKPGCTVSEIEVTEQGGEHELIIQNFCDAIQGKAQLIAPAEEGLHSIAINNAIMLSSFEKRFIDIPSDENLFAEKLNELQENSGKIKRKIVKTQDDFSKSF